MCQAFHGEQQGLIRSELFEIRRKWERHKSGEALLTHDEIMDLVVKKMMLEEAQS